MNHPEIIKLGLAYTLAGAVIFTVIATCLSLIGVVRFVNPRQQNKLFTILIVEAVTLAVGVFGDVLHLDPSAVARKIQEPLQTKLEANEDKAGQLHDKVVESTHPATPELQAEARALGTWFTITTAYDDTPFGHSNAKKDQTEFTRKLADQPQALPVGI